MNGSQFSRSYTLSTAGVLKYSKYLYIKYLCLLCKKWKRLRWDMHLHHNPVSQGYATDLLLEITVFQASSYAVGNFWLRFVINPILSYILNQHPGGTWVFLAGWANSFLSFLIPTERANSIWTYIHPANCPLIPCSLIGCAPMTLQPHLLECVMCA